MAAFPFPPSDHLRRGEDFQRLRQAGRVTRHPALWLSCTPNDLPHNRYGFIVSKQLGNAVVRNRTRRLLREVIRLRRGQIRLGYDIALIARTPLVGESSATVARIVQELIVRAGLHHPDELRPSS